MGSGHQAPSQRRPRLHAVQVSGGRAASALSSAVGVSDLLTLGRRSYLDMMKVIIFSYMFWFVLTITFITGTTR